MPMLLDLSLKDYALIDRLELPFGPGLWVITGETGTGKSILVESLDLLFGVPAGPEEVRTGAEEAVLEGVFKTPEGTDLPEELKELGLAAGEEIIVQRVIRKDGRDAFRVNGRRLPKKKVEELGGVLLDIHGQHQQQGLLKTDNHREYLDRFGDLLEAVREVTDLFVAVKENRRKIEEIRDQIRLGAQKVDLTRFQLEEIEKASLNPGEEEELRERRDRLAHVAFLQEMTGESLRLLSEEDQAAASLIYSALRALQRAADKDPGLEESVEAISGVLTQIEEVSRDLAGYLESLQVDPGTLEEIEARLILIGNLKRKYGSTIEEILAFADNLRSTFLTTEDLEANLAELDKETSRQTYLLFDKVRELSRGRKKAAGRLEKEVAERLKTLSMSRCRFRVMVEPLEEGMTVDNRLVGPMGGDQVRFLIAPNPGEEERPLEMIASGGELSRIMLALKAALADKDRVETLVFDEIDVGIGGRVASVVGETMKVLSADRQIFCVTHLPQIAALSDHHLRVEKKEIGGRTKVMVEKLDPAAREQELARMLAGAKVTETVRRHAAELLKEGNKE